MNPICEKCKKREFTPYCHLCGKKTVFNSYQKSGDNYETIFFCIDCESLEIMPSEHTRNPTYDEQEQLFNRINSQD